MAMHLDEGRSCPFILFYSFPLIRAWMMLLKLVVSNWIYPSYGRAFVWDYQHFGRHEPHFTSKKKRASLLTVLFCVILKPHSLENDPAQNFLGMADG